MDRRDFIAGAGAFVLKEGLRSEGTWAAAPNTQEEYITAAYYFGNFHVDPRNEKAHGPHWTEWNLVRAARQRFPGHHQPRVPYWGYEDESDPHVFEKKIAVARLNGVNALIFDWYWYKDGPFLNGALDRGFLKAANNKDLKFAIMWANHDWYDIHPAKLASPPYLQFAGGVTRETFDTMAERLLHLFQHPSYLRIEGAPYFSIYELYRFVRGMGGVQKAEDALDSLRSKVKALGMPEVHINAVTWGVQLLPGQSEVSNLAELLERLRVDSTSSYVWVHHARSSSGLTTEYADIRRQYETFRNQAAIQYGRPYFPNVTVGWDSTPRTCQTDEFCVADYPFTSVIVNNSAHVFEEALRSARQFAATVLPKGRRMITINSWNEWTEGSYLEPDKENGTAYLEAIRKVFKA